MGIKERRLLERESIKKKIFDAASEIIIDEGFEKLSIRKIADKVEYSPGVIYNYFKDKNDIVKLIIAENIQRICESMLSLELQTMKPDEALKLGLTEFATILFENHQQYKAIMMSGIDISMFKEDNNETNEIKNLLINVLKDGNASGVFDIKNEEITALILIASTFGIINTLVKEKVEDKRLQEMIITCHVDILFRGVLNNKR